MLELNKIYNEDCLGSEDLGTGMWRIPDKSVDMIFADLPFGTTNCKWDTVIPLDKLWEHYKRVIKDNGAIVLFAQTPFDKILGASNIRMLKYEWIWEKTSATGHLNAKKMPMKAHENILVFYKKLPVYNPQKTQGHKPINTYTKYMDTQNKGEIYNSATQEVSGGGNTDRYPRSILTFASDKQKLHLHPTQKPLALCQYFIRTYTNEGMTVLDNVIGSGTTAIACIKENRNFIGYELLEKNSSIANKRIKDYLENKGE